METEEKKDIVVQESKKVIKVNFDSKTIETVKQTIFPGADDAQLHLYLHKCVTDKVHPLDKMIHPTIFKGKVVFIKSIDLFRSDAESTGEYDGQDEYEFEYLEGETEHPFKARCRIYKKGIERAFVGVAKWDEFYPADESKRFMWDKMSENQLGKCAEAQGLRKAFPKKLHGDYIEAEMDQAARDPVKENPKTITKPTTEVKKKTHTSSSGTDRAMPTEDERKKHGLVSVKQGWFVLHKLKEQEIDEKMFLAILKKQSVFYLFKRKDILDRLLKQIETNPGFFKKVEPQQPVEPEKVETMSVLDQETFLSGVKAMIKDTTFKNIGEAEFALQLNVGYAKFADVPGDEKEQQGVYAWLNTVIDNKEQAGA